MSKSLSEEMNGFVATGLLSGNEQNLSEELQVYFATNLPKGELPAFINMVGSKLVPAAQAQIPSRFDDNAMSALVKVMGEKLDPVAQRQCIHFSKDEGIKLDVINTMKDKLSVDAQHTCMLSGPDEIRLAMLRTLKEKLAPYTLELGIMNAEDDKIRDEILPFLGGLNGEFQQELVDLGDLKIISWVVNTAPVLDQKAASLLLGSKEPELQDIIETIKKKQAASANMADDHDTPAP